MEVATFPPMASLWHCRRLYPNLTNHFAAVVGPAPQHAIASRSTMRNAVDEHNLRGAHTKGSQHLSSIAEKEWNRGVPSRPYVRLRSLRFSVFRAQS
jgi:hypothetical protein